MKKLFLGLFLLFAGSFIMAQSIDDYIEIQREVLNMEKKAAIAEVMMLTEEEGEIFWPLYNEYNNELYKIQTKRVKLIKDFAENYDKMTSEKADEIWMAFFDYRTELLKLNKQYYKKFKKEMPAEKVVKYFQAENKIAVLVDFTLASEIPFLEME
jgi:hypothetical protein